MGDLDPACPELQRLKAFHSGQGQLLHGPALADVVRRHQAEELRKHAVECERCFEHARLPTACAGCGGALVREAGRLACRARFHGIKSFFRGHRGAPRSVPLPPPRRHAPPPERPEPRPVQVPVQGERPRVAPAPKPASKAAPKAAKAPRGSARAEPPTPKATRARNPTQPARSDAPPRSDAPLRPPAKTHPDALAKALRVLGLRSDADAAAIRAAYREQAHLFHPDKAMSMPKDMREAAEARMKEVNHAYEALKRAGKA